MQSERISAARRDPSSIVEGSSRRLRSCEASTQVRNSALHAHRGDAGGRTLASKALEQISRVEMQSGTVGRHQLRVSA